MLLSLFLSSRRLYFGLPTAVRNIRLTICHAIGKRKRGTYGGAICRRNGQKTARPIYFVLAFLRLDVPIDRSSFGSLKTAQEILQEITPRYVARGRKIESLDARDAGSFN